MINLLAFLQLSVNVSENLSRFEGQSLPEFLVQLYEYDPLDDSRDVFHEIGIHRQVYWYWCDTCIMFKSLSFLLC